MEGGSLPPVPPTQSPDEGTGSSPVNDHCTHTSKPFKERRWERESAPREPETPGKGHWERVERQKLAVATAASDLPPSSSACLVRNLFKFLSAELLVGTRQDRRQLSSVSPLLEREAWWGPES